MSTTPAGGRSHAALVDQPIDTDALLRTVADPGAGATALFLGTVRNVHDGRSVTGIDYHAYTPMATRQLAAIVAEASQRYGTCAVSAQHRLGYLALGETSVAIAASHERRAPAFAAARYVIEEIKRRLPVWKREHYADGTREWVDPVNDTQTATAAHTGDAP
jgi:molybdopterin synthase catalytic subunit